MKRVAIIGGGLAGLISSIHLSKKGVPCILFERKAYPFQRVCGEYISNEVVPYLKKLDIYPEIFNPSLINKFELSSVRGQSATMPLDLGGFGISRFTFDNYLYEKAKALGVEIYVNTEVNEAVYTKEKFVIKTAANDYEADVVIGSFGKRSRLDVKMNRRFIKKRSPYVGIKYHAKTNHNADLVSLHNFRGGYCGVANVENGITNICYLAERSVLQQYKNIPEMEEKVLYKNPLLKKIFESAEFITTKPLVINEISFATKAPVEDHILMAGDAAGMITPLCGNGMAIAIHTAKILSELVVDFCEQKISREDLEKKYSEAWNVNFAKRLWIGRNVQKLFGNSLMSDLGLKIVLLSKPIARIIMKNTHGDVF